MATKAPTCPKHPHVILRCAACAGSKGGKVGGKVLSAKKLRALKRIAKLPRRHTGPGVRE